MPPGSQVVLLQQPSQLAPLQVQAPLTHAWPLVQVTQIAPLAPQLSVVSPASQVAPLQHPFGQLLGSQVHLPLTQV